MITISKFNSENEFCPLIFNRGKYNLSILSSDYGLSNNSLDPIFFVPIRNFLSCGSIWDALNLSTIFWEKSAYGIESSYNETQRIKIAYLIAFASDLAPICKHWASECMDKTINYRELQNTVYFRIEIFDKTLTDKIIKAIEANNFNLSIVDNIYTVF